MKIEFALDNKSNTTSKDKAVVVMDTKSLVLQTTTSQTTAEDEEEDETTTDQRFPRLLSDDISVDSNASCSHTNKWSAPYDPAPVVDQSTILWVGLVLFVLATVWPPLLLLVAYIASKLIPYSFRVNDDPVVRRRLFAEFASTQEDLPRAFKQTPDHLDVQHGYWTNKRYVLQRWLYDTDSSAVKRFFASIFTSHHSFPSVVCCCQHEHAQRNVITHGHSFAQEPKNQGCGLFLSRIYRFRIVCKIGGKSKATRTRDCLLCH